MSWQFYLLTLSCFVLLVVARKQALPEHHEEDVTEIPLELIDDSIQSHQLFKRQTKRDGIQLATYTETLLTSPDSPLSITRVQLPSTERFKRGVHDKVHKWTHNIPYVIHESYSKLGPTKTLILKRAMKRIMNYVCVKYHDVTDTWNSSNSNWFMENGFLNNAYLLFKTGSGCSASTGYGSGNGPMKIQPCGDFQINSHELLHTLGGSHSQSIARRDWYITVNRDNVMPELQFTYNKNDNLNYIDEGMDTKSTLIYSDKTWSRNGLQTYLPIRDDIFQLENPVSSDATVFYELALLYKCNEIYCKNSQVDCGQGYHSVFKGVCQCICPADFDPATNCKTVFNQPNTFLSWPQTPMAVLAGEPDYQCPTEFNSETGWFTFDGILNAKQAPVPAGLPSQNQTLFIPVCTKDGPKPVKVDWESWPPGGTFCIIKSKRADCGGAFTEFAMSFQSLEAVQYNGSLGDIDVSGCNITMKLCCKNQEHGGLVIDLPNSKAFRLLAIGHCPRVRGMREYKGIVSLFTDVKSMTGVLGPQYHVFSKELQIHQCYYLPPKYGCNHEVTLDSTTKSITVTTPGFDESREPNRRCIYYFTAPSNSKIRITFHTCDLDENDKLLVKRFYKWQEPYRIDNSKCPAQFVSEGQFLIMDYWSSWENATKRGLNFTAEVLLAEDFCYNATTRGEDYYGETSVTETYEECLHWSETTDCWDFPADGMSTIWLLNSANKCRNPDGKLLQPWCYTHKNGTNCRKRYCDVCNFEKAVDVLSVCADLMAEDPEFCRSGIQRFACFKTCQFSQASTQRKTCGPPKVPSDGTMMGPDKSTYLEGEKVVLNCSSEFSEDYGEMLCTRSGWTVLENACSECPRDWVPYRNRCFIIPKIKLGARDAEQTCQSYGRYGSLFRVRDKNDALAIRKYKQGMSGHFKKTTWISGEFRPDKVWYYTSKDTQMEYFNWSSNHETKVSDLSYNCVRMIAEQYSDAGGWNPASCENAGDLQQFVCQQRRNRQRCKDTISKNACERLMTVFPSFCTDFRFKSRSGQTCARSCGACGTGNQQCVEPTSKEYTRTSESATITVGQTMIFTCNPGYFYVSGNLQRACSSSRNLLGQDPECIRKPVPVDVNLNSVIPRTSNYPAGLGMLLTEAHLRVPFRGVITKWYYYCRKPGDIYFLVYRQTSSSYTFVGSNNVYCQTGWMWSLNVPEEKQISVLEGDIFGVYSPDKNVINADDCSGAREKIMRNPFVQRNNLADFRSLDFTGEKCMVPSVGYRVEPREN